MKPGGEGLASFGFGAVGAGVGPFLQQGAVQAFDLAVGLWPVGAGAFVGDAGRGHGLAPGGGFVAGAVVGQHPFDGDAAGGGERLGAGPESGGGGFSFVGGGLAVGPAGGGIGGGGG